VQQVRLLFVCLGNICRSPTAHGVMEAMVAAEDLPFSVVIESAGTGAWHVGHPPDERSQEAALRRGVDLRGQRAQKVTVGDFQTFHHIVAMDEENLSDLETLRPAEAHAELSLLLSHAEAVSLTSVPDPYYGGANGFEHVLDLVEQGCAGLLEELRRRQA
jgi:low molecular weight protein-tyrosine phosphatase